MGQRGEFIVSHLNSTPVLPQFELFSGKQDNSCSTSKENRLIMGAKVSKLPNQNSPKRNHMAWKYTSRHLRPTSTGQPDLFTSSPAFSQKWFLNHPIKWEQKAILENLRCFFYQTATSTEYSYISHTKTASSLIYDYFQSAIV